MTDTIDLLRNRQTAAFARVKLLDDGNLAYSLPSSPTLDVGRMTLEYKLSTGVIDRQNDLVVPDGVDWTDHRNNPVTLLQHETDKPFGLSRSPDGEYAVYRKGDEWFGKSWLYQNDRFAEEVFYMAEKGALNGASIGFVFKAPHCRSHVQKSMDGFDFTVIDYCRPFEWSAVHIPMNQEATLIAAEVVRKGMGGKRLSDRALSVFPNLEALAKGPAWTNGWESDAKLKDKRDTTKGQWITIGGTKGKDGKRHGGSPVFVQNGRITKGHPSLMGKKPHDIGGDTKETSHRTDAARGKSHAIAKIRKEAKNHGHDPKEVDHLASEIRSNHNAFAAERAEMLRDARKYVGNYSGTELRNAAKRADKGGDYTKIAGFDLATEAAVKDYPHHFHAENGENGSHYDQMWDMLIEGNPEAMTEEDAYEQAFDYVMRNGPKAQKDDDFAFGANDDDIFKAMTTAGRMEGKQPIPGRRYLTHPKTHTPHGKTKAMDTQTPPPVDPVTQAADQSGPPMPIGAQIIAGLHDYHMQAAQFYADSLAALEPEMKTEFAALEKIVMKAVAETAKKFNKRYPDLPPLDGADWTDPDEADLDEAPTGGDGEADVPGDEPAFGGDEDADDFGHPEPDGDEDEYGAPVGEGDDDSDEFGDEDEDDDPPFKKSFHGTDSRLKVLVTEHRERLAAAEARRKTVQAPDAIDTVKQSARFLRVIAGDVRQGKDVRARAKALRHSLLKALPAVESPPAPPAVQSDGINAAEVIDHLKAAVAAADPVAELWGEVVRVKGLTGK